MRIELLNPYSHILKKYPLIITSTDQEAFSDGDFKIYRHFDKHFLHTFKNIVIAERGGINKKLIENVKNDIKPIDEAEFYHDYERPKDAMLKGIQIAEILNFKII